MLGKAQAIAETPYQTYQGPLTAGQSGLQSQVFQGLGALTVPSSIGQAATTAGNVAQKAGQMSYGPGQFGNQFTAPGAYQTGDFSNQFNAPGAYQAGQFSTGTFGADQAQQYMNPYLQSALNPQLEEARRQSQITQLGNQAKATQAGAFGGGRQAIMDAETQRSLGSNLANITGQGYNTAYTNAMGQFNADQARQLQAQQAGEQSRQFGAGQGMTAAQQAAQYGQSAQQGREASRQFGAGQGMTAAQAAAQYGLAGQQAGEQSRQFGANYGLQGLQQQLAGAQAQGQLGTMQNQAGIAGLNAQLAGGQAQRDIEQQGVTADYNEFLQQRDFPMKQLQFQQSMLQGLPISTVANVPQGQSGIQQAVGTANDISSLLKQLKII
jgi:hypothetical protein